MINAKIKWNRGFLRRQMRQFKKAQNFIDEQCVEKMTEFVPVAAPMYANAGRLRDSVKICKPGQIVYEAPYARTQYYVELNHEGTGNPKAERMWFEVMKKKYTEEIRKGAEEIAGKK